MSDDAAPRTKTLAEVGRFWRDRRGNAVRLELRRYEGQDFVDLWQLCTAKDGVLRPTKKGITLPVLRLPDLQRAVDKAFETAVQLGLLEAAP